MFVGYMRISKSDGTQTLALQRDALIEAGVAPTRLYEDLASGRKADRPGLTACLKSTPAREHPGGVEAGPARTGLEASDRTRWSPSTTERLA